MFRDNEVREPAYRGMIEQIIATLGVFVVPLRDTMALGVR
jgi:hypothetical protein